MPHRNDRNWDDDSDRRGSASFQGRGRGSYAQYDAQGERSSGRSQRAAQQTHDSGYEDDRWGSYGTRHYMTDPRDEIEFRKGYQGRGYERGQGALDEEFDRDASNRDFGSYGNEESWSDREGFSSRNRGHADRDFMDEDPGHYSQGRSADRARRSGKAEWEPRRQQREPDWDNPREGRHGSSRMGRNRR